MLNSSHVQRKIEQSKKLRYLMQGKLKPQQIVNNLYLTILSRYPTPDEVAVATAYAPGGKTAKRETVIDLTWALFNSPEFLYKH
jgi:hypothetical protein